MEELYNALFSSGDYTKSFEEFKEQFNSEESVKALYSALNENEDYTKSFEEFKTQFKFEIPQTAKTTPQEAGAPVEEVAAPETPDMESPSEDTLLESPKIDSKLDEELKPYQDRLVSTLNQAESQRELFKQEANSGPIEVTETMSFKEYRESGLMPPEEAKFYQGSGSKKVSVQKYPYEDFIEDAKKIIKERKGDLSEENITQKAKDLYVESKVIDQKLKLQEDILSEFEDEYGPGFFDNISDFYAKAIARSPVNIKKSKKRYDYEAKRASLASSFDTYSEEQQKKADDIDKKSSLIVADAEKDIKEILKLQDKAKAQGGLEQVDIERYESLYDGVKFKENQLKTLNEEYSESLSNMEDYKQIAMQSLKSYDSFDKGSANVVSSAVDIVGNLGRFGAEYSKFGLAERIMGEEDYEEFIESMPFPIKQYLKGNKEARKKILQASDYLSDASENIKDTVRRDKSIDDVKSLSDIGTFLFDLASGQTANLALTATMPQTGIYLMGMSGAGAKIKEIDEEISEGADYNIFEQIASPVAYGGFETFSEKIKLNKFNKATRKIAEKVSKRLPQGEELSNLMRIQLPSLKREFKEAFSDITEEGISESIAQIGQNLTDIYILDKKNVGIFDGVDEAFISGAALGSMFQTPVLAAEVGRFMSTDKTSRENIRLSQQAEKAKREFDRLSAIGKENRTPEQQAAFERASQEMTDAYKGLEDSFRTSAMVIDSLSVLEKRALVDLNTKISDLKFQSSELTDAQEKEARSLFAQRLLILRSGMSRVADNNVESVSKLSEFLGIQSELLNNDAELAQRLIEEGLEQDDQYFEGPKDKRKLKKGLGGVLLFDEVTDKNVIFLNKAKMKGEGGTEMQFNVAVHEIIHPIINRMFGVSDGNFDAQNDFFNEVIKVLPKKQRENLRDFITKRGENYNDRLIKGEGFSMLSDAISKNIIDMSDTGNLVDKMKGVFNNRFNKKLKEKYKDDIKFDINIKTPKDLLDLINSITTQASTGNIDPSLLDDFVNAKNKSKANVVQSSIQSEKDALYDRYINGNLSDFEYEDSLDTLNAKEEESLKPFIKKASQSDFKTILDEAGNPETFNPEVTPFEVMETIENMIKIKAKRFRTLSGDIVNLESLPGFSMEDFTSQVFMNMVIGRKKKDGTITDGYLKLFDPSINDSFYGYVNAQLQNRMINVLKEGEVVGQKFNQNIDERVDIASEEVSFDEFDTLEAQEEVESDLIDPVDIIPEQFRQEAISEIDSKIENISLEGLLFKNTPNLVVSTLAKVFDVRESVIEKASQNLNTSELISSAPVLYEMADSILEIMPFGAILEGNQELVISEKLIGTGTGLPRKILNAFYEKGERLVSKQEGIGRKGAGLEPFVLKKNLTKDDFLSALGINPDGTHNPDIKPKSPESQTRRAMLDLFGKLNTNTRARVKMEEKGMSILAINDAAVGKNIAQASFGRLKKDYELLLPNGDIIDLSKRFAISKLLQLENKRSRLTQYISLFDKYVDVKLVAEELEKIKPQYRGEKTLIDIETATKHVNYGLAIINIIPEYIREVTGPVLLRHLGGITRKTAFVVGDKTRSRSLSGELSEVVIKDRNDRSSLAESLDDLNDIPTINEVEFKIQELKGDSIASKGTKNIAERLVKNIKKNGGKMPMTGDQVAKKLRDIWKKEGVSPTVKLKEIVNLIKSEGTQVKNDIRLDLIKLTASAYGDWVNQKGISAQEKARRVAFASEKLVDTSGGFKRLGSITRRQSLLSTIMPGIRWEHIIPAMVYDLAILRAAITNNISHLKPYRTAFFSEDITKYIDNETTGFILSLGKKFFTKFTAVGPRFDLAKSRYELLKVKYNTESFAQASIVDGEMRTKDQEAKMMEDMMGGILKGKTGIPVRERLSKSEAEVRAFRRKKTFRSLSPTADDFNGFLYSFLGKGKEGDAQMKFFKKTLIDPFNRAYVGLVQARQKISRDFKDLNKEFEVVKKSLGKKSGYKDFTNDQALRVYMYTMSGATPKSMGLSEADVNTMTSIVRANKDMTAYATFLMELTGDTTKWVEPQTSWTVGSVFRDVERIIDNVKRSEYLEEWQTNVDAIFSENNLNKIEASYGTDYRNALEEMLYSMKKGKVIPEKTSKEMSGFQKWLTGSVAVTMFLNRRSAVLQLLSFANYFNWTDNNPIQAAKAFANIPQYSKDFARIFNSDYLKERRGGLKTEVEAAVFANELRKGGADGVRGFIDKLLQYGFTLTQIGDSMAISIGGATMYRNRKNAYMREGLTEKEAHDQAWLDFIEITETSQQSARPDKLSMQQTNSVGRVFLAFQNTPMQYYRIVSKASSDIINRRGDLKTNISKIAYYGFVQGLIFSGLQQALFAFLGDAPDEDEKEEFDAEKEKRLIRTINNTLDTMLKGTGYHGVIMATAKNAALEYMRQEEKGFKKDHVYTAIEVLNLSAPIGIKARTLYQGAYQNYNYNKEIMDDLGYDIDNPAIDVVASLADFSVNLPADKVIQMMRGLKEAADQQNETWQRIALALGWSTWNLGMPNEKIDKAKEINTKRKRAEATRERQKEARRRARKKEREKR